MFPARAVYHITRVGWRQCWQRRYVEIETQPLEVVPNMEVEDNTEPVTLNTDGLTHELADDNQN